MCTGIIAKAERQPLPPAAGTCSAAGRGRSGPTNPMSLSLAEGWRVASSTYASMSDQSSGWQRTMISRLFDRPVSVRFGRSDQDGKSSSVALGNYRLSVGGLLHGSGAVPVVYGHVATTQERRSGRAVRLCRFRESIGRHVTDDESYLLVFVDLSSQPSQPVYRGVPGADDQIGIAVLV